MRNTKIALSCSERSGLDWSTLIVMNVVYNKYGVWYDGCCVLFCKYRGMRRIESRYTARSFLCWRSLNEKSLCRTKVLMVAESYNAFRF
jgi:hypothetical protein